MHLVLVLVSFVFSQTQSLSPTSFVSAIAEKNIVSGKEETPAQPRLETSALPPALPSTDSTLSDQTVSSNAIPSEVESQNNDSSSPDSGSMSVVFIICLSLVFFLACILIGITLFKRRRVDVLSDKRESLDSFQGLTSAQLQQMEAQMNYRQINFAIQNKLNC